ncbi:MAG: aldehyde dehydrogenase [Butyrivibrio sp.]|nr:aldehyde dehydrogenase [Butyrivibrio sp.]
MTKEEITKIIDKQRCFFATNKTKDVSFRIEALKKLRKEIKNREPEILTALYKDLGKSRSEAYLTELSIVYNEINIVISNLKKWSRPKKVKGSIATFPSGNYIYSEPYGIVLIIAPWNYPFNLLITPLIGAIAAGNCCILRSSENSINTAKIIPRIICNIFPENYIYCLDTYTEHENVLNQRYDYIFFTGSPRVGKIIMEKASEHLTPISLELGGKSPCFVDKNANIEVAAKRIIWGKFINAGQTCISIDFVLVHKDIKEKLIAELKKQLDLNYKDAQKSDSYPKIINKHHYIRLKKLLAGENNVIGGICNEKECKISPALITETDFSKPIMQEEIFGPLLPIIAYSNIDETIKELKEKELPLACYIFSEDKKYSEKIINELSFGGGCVNDVILHICNHNLPFGGVGQSGMGAYHGCYSFETFSQKKAIIKNTTRIDLPLRYILLNKKYNQKN